MADNNEQITFTEKEERILKLAWQCLKSGPPEVDIAKLQVIAGFNTQKTAANTWGVIKKKLAAMNPEDSTASPASEATQSKKRSGKKAADVADEGDDEEATPTKKQRKTPAKKGKGKVLKAEADEDAADEESKGEED